MIHTYRLNGMHCTSCVGRVQQALEGVEGVKKAIVSLNPQEAVVSMGCHVDTAELDRAVQTAGSYSLTDEVEVIDKMKPPIVGAESTPQPAITAEPDQFSLTTYKPLLLIGAFIVGVVGLVELREGEFDWMRAMNNFMAGFFLVFSFFKLLNVQDFANSYRMYDIVAKAIPGYGLAYPFIELALGVAYLLNWNPLVTNTVTLVVMGVSLIGVVQSVLDKRKIQCACLGAVFNLPMSTVTIVEDSLMMAMAGLMLWTMLV
ncbi:MAG: heavy-metal-associated domain-containing protein [Cytophagales bacterium]|nr:MAG: heavy-metal-associated domain-containing protein [Cytophagales bacterium]